MARPGFCDTTPFPTNTWIGSFPQEFHGLSEKDEVRRADLEREMDAG